MKLSNLHRIRRGYKPQQPTKTETQIYLTAHLLDSMKATTKYQIKKYLKILLILLILLPITHPGSNHTATQHRTLSTHNLQNLTITLTLHAPLSNFIDSREFIPTTWNPDKDMIINCTPNPYKITLHPNGIRIIHLTIPPQTIGDTTCNIHTTAPPGNYTLHGFIANKHGQWNTTGNTHTTIHTTVTLTDILQEIQRWTNGQTTLGELINLILLYYL